MKISEMLAAIMLVVALYGLAILSAGLDPLETRMEAGQ